MSKNSNSKKKLSKKIVLVLAILLGCIGILSIIIYVFSGMCSITYKTEKIFSSDGSYYFRVQNTMCGGAGGRSTEDLVITNEKKNLSDFFSGNYRNTVMIITGPEPSLKASWINDRTLEVNFSACRGVNTQEDSWRDLKITYKGECKVDQYGQPIISE